MQRLALHGQTNGVPPYLINLDPAVKNLPYGPHIDIRDTVDYKQVMSQYGLGPNGAIMTSLNLFATRFDQVLDLIGKRENVEHAIIDTPGQIEAFTWSASGAVFTESLASRFPTIMVYVVDTPRTENPNTYVRRNCYIGLVYLIKTSLGSCRICYMLVVFYTKFAYPLLSSSTKRTSLVMISPWNG